AAPPAGRLPFRHQPRPAEASLVVERQDTACEQGLRSFRAREPGIESIGLLGARFLQNASADFGEGERGDEQMLNALSRHPGEERFGWLRFDDVVDDVGIEKIARHRSTLRPCSRGRVRSRSAPTSGERRSAARMPPDLGGWPATACCTVWRM